MIKLLLFLKVTMGKSTKSSDSLNEILFLFSIKFKDTIVTNTSKK